MPAWLIDRDSVSSDILDGEVVAIHLGTGIYYSLRGSAATLWQALSQANDLAGLARALTRQFDVTEESARGAAQDFVGRLVAEKLLREVPAAAPAEEAPAGERRPFVAPAVERYADLQDLLLLDPIHDVGEFGWPHKPADPQ